MNKTGTDLDLITYIFILCLYRETDIDIEVEERKLKSCLKNFSQVNICGEVEVSEGLNNNTGGGGGNIKTKSRNNRSVGTQTRRIACKLM